MAADATGVTTTTEAIARRRDAHVREMKAQRRWTIAVRGTSLLFAASYLFLLIVVRVMEPFYLVVNLLAILTGACGFIVYRIYQLPTILAELPRLSDQDRHVNLAAIEPVRAELLGAVLPELGLARTSDEAAGLDDDELVRRISGLERRNWRGIGWISSVLWLAVVATVFTGVMTYRPQHGVSLVDRLEGKTPAIERAWSPLRR